MAGLIEGVASLFAPLFAPLSAKDEVRVPSDTRPAAARRGDPAKRRSLRYPPGAPGLAGWPALPERDRRLLEWLLVGEHLSAELAHVLAYPSLRMAQYRLQRLRTEGLLVGGWAANMRKPRGRFTYRLTDETRRGLEKLVWGERRLRSFASGEAGAVMHHLAVHDLLAAFLRSAVPEQGIVAWLPQRVAAALFDGYLRPDAIAAVRFDDRLVLLFVELDTGSERPPVLAAKLRRYRAVLSTRAEVAPAHLLIVLGSRRRLGTIGSALAAVPGAGPGPMAWLALEGELRRAPWAAALHPLIGEVRTLDELPAHPAVQKWAVARSGCLVELEQAEVIDERALAQLPMLAHFRRRAGL